MSTLNRMAKNSSMRLRPRLHLVEAVEVEHRRPEQRDHGQQQQVARERGHALGDGQVRRATRLGVEAEEVGERARPGSWRATSTRTNTADHHAGLELHHGASVGRPAPPGPRSTKARKRASKTWRLWASARARSAAVLKRSASERVNGGPQRRRRGLVEDDARLARGRPTPARRPRRRRPPGARRPWPRAGTIPKSSTPGMITARQPR